MNRTKVINASSLSTDPEVAAWLFDNAAEQAQFHDSGDPLCILMQREAEGDFTFHEADGVQYPHFAPSFS